MIKLEYLLAEGSSLSVDTDHGTYTFPISRNLRNAIATAVHNEVLCDLENALGVATALKPADDTASAGSEGKGSRNDVSGEEPRDRRQKPQGENGRYKHIPVGEGDDALNDSPFRGDLIPHEDEIVIGG